MNDFMQFIHNLPFAMGIWDNHQIINQNNAFEVYNTKEILNHPNLTQLIKKFQANKTPIMAHQVALPMQSIIRHDNESQGDYQFATIALCGYYDKILISIIPQYHQQKQQMPTLMFNIAQGLSHELRNPLASIKAAAQLLSNPQDANLCQVIIDQSNRINDIIAKIDNFGNDALADLQPINIYAVIQPCVQSFKIRYPWKFIEKYDPSLPLIRANEGMLQQVFTNLLENSCQELTACAQNNPDFQGEITIVIAFINDARQSPLKALISISDNGKGINNNILDKIFQPFITNKIGGTGLGLALCAQFIGKMGGVITAHNQQIGAEFKVFLNTDGK